MTSALTFAEATRCRHERATIEGTSQSKRNLAVKPANDDRSAGDAIGAGYGPHTFPDEHRVKLCSSARELRKERLLRGAGINAPAPTGTWTAKNDAHPSILEQKYRDLRVRMARGRLPKEETSFVNTHVNQMSAREARIQVQMRLEQGPEEEARQRSNGRGELSRDVWYG